MRKLPAQRRRSGRFGADLVDDLGVGQKGAAGATCLAPVRENVEVDRKAAAISSGEVSGGADMAELLVTRVCADGSVEFLFEGRIYRAEDGGALLAASSSPAARQGVAPRDASPGAIQKPPRRSTSDFVRAQRADRLAHATAGAALGDALEPSASSAAPTAPAPAIAGRAEAARRDALGRAWVVAKGLATQSEEQDSPRGSPAWLEERLGASLAEELGLARGDGAAQML